MAGRALSMLGGLAKGLGGGIYNVGMALREEALKREELAARQAEAAKDREFRAGEAEKDRIAADLRQKTDQTFRATENSLERSSREGEAEKDRGLRRGLQTAEFSQQDKLETSRQTFQGEQARADRAFRSGEAANERRLRGLTSRFAGKDGQVYALDDASGKYVAQTDNMGEPIKVAEPKKASADLKSFNDLAKTFDNDWGQVAAAFDAQGNKQLGDMARAAQKAGAVPVPEGASANDLTEGKYYITPTGIRKYLGGGQFDDVFDDGL